MIVLWKREKGSMIEHRRKKEKERGGEKGGREKREKAGWGWG